MCCCLAQDISERALLERQLRQAQKMEAIGQLAAGVAHDFNNILTVIQGHAGLLQPEIGLRQSAKRNPWSRSARATARAATLIRQLLMFSRKQVMQFRHLDLNDTFAQRHQDARTAGGRARADRLLPQSPIPAIHADSSMVEQIAMNLAVNARDAMPNGGRLAITTSLRDHSTARPLRWTLNAAPENCLPDLPRHRHRDGHDRF